MKSLATLCTAWALMVGVAAAETYEYDALNRLTRVTRDDGHAESFSYDAAGNVIERRVGPAPLPDDGWVVTPDRGTVGTRLVVQVATGGLQGAAVRVGGRPCHALSASATRIECLVLHGLEAETYDVQVSRRGQEHVIPDAFRMMAPAIHQVSPTTVSRKGSVTITGSYFGTRMGKVALVDQRGHESRCGVRPKDWTMDEIECAVGIHAAGTYRVRVENAVGSVTAESVLTVEGKFHSRKP
jgi:YD repeat-containing protein